MNTSEVTSVTSQMNLLVTECLCVCIAYTLQASGSWLSSQARAREARKCVRAQVPASNEVFGFITTHSAVVMCKLMPLRAEQDICQVSLSLGKTYKRRSAATLNVLCLRLVRVQSTHAHELVDGQ